MKKLAAVSLLSILGACSQQGAPEQVSESLVVNQHDATTLDVSFTAAGQTVRMTSIESAPKVVDLTMDFGANNVVAFRLDYGAGEGDFISNGQAFDVTQIVLIKGLLNKLPSLLPSDSSQYSNVENAAIRQTNYLSETPIGQLIEPFHFVAERGWTYISCTCKSQYDGHDGNHVGGVGCGCTGGSGNGCKGRCGAGCTQDGANINAYTQDCLCHDYNMCSWTTASDDFSFAASNCGASSGCY